MIMMFGVLQFIYLAYDNDVWCTAVHLPGIDNITADRESRLVCDETEWMLNKTIFQKIINLGIGPSIDLFASRLNFQLEKFESWKADPLASHIDAFTLCWTDLNFDAFTLCWTDLNFDTYL